MFTKRGYAPRVVWRSRARQASDTDIGELAGLERKTGVDFEFYLHQTSQEPVTARTAVAWLGSGGELWHDLLVYEAQLVHPRERIALDAALERMGFGDLGRNTDLSAANAAQLGFALRTARALHRRPRLPYVHEQGGPALREDLAAYLDKFWGLGAAKEDLFVGPNRQAVACALLQALCDPLDLVLVSRNVADVYAQALRRAGVQTLVANAALDEVVELARGLKPRVLIVRADEQERRNVRALEALLATGATVIFDETGHLRLLPELYKNEVFEFLAARPRSAIVLAELREEAVYPELQLAAALGPRGMMERIAAAGEAAYCRGSHLAELYFTHLIEQALAFHITLGRGETEAPTPLHAETPPVRASARIQALQAIPAFAPAPEPPEGVIRLDYGENEYPVPRRLVAGVLSGLLEPPQPGLPAAVRRAASAYVRETRGGTFAPEAIAVGAGCVTLLADLVSALGRRLGRAPRVLLPRCYYGIFPGVLMMAGAQTRIVDDLREPRDADAILLTHPGNPTGVYYEESELRRLAAAVPYLLVDEIYGMLSTTGAPWFSAARLEEPGVVVLCGLSKEFCAGGLRIGFAACRDASLAAAIEEEALVHPDRFALRAAEHLLAAYRTGSRGEIDTYSANMRRHLGEQRAKFIDALAQLGIRAQAPQAGVSLFPEVGDDVAFARTLADRARLWVNRGDWSGTPGRVRIVTSLEPRRADEAAERLRKLPPGPWR
jgi:aspartate/methionine/tyrosine aminotransferase